MDTWFHNRSKIVQVILLLLPVVNWFTELLVRWSKYLKNGGALRLLICIFVTIPSGVIIGWLDALWTVLFNKLCAE